MGAARAQAPDADETAPAAKTRPVYGSNMTAALLPKDWKVEDNIVYKTAGGQELKLIAFYPKQKKFAQAPLLVFIHGGGWAGGNRFVITKSAAGWLDVIGALNDAGVVCVSIEYRLLKREVDPHLTAMDQEADCRDAIHFLVENAARFGIDPQRIATMGGSAGGHLSLVTALGKDADYPCDPALAKFSDYKILTEAAYFPLVSLVDPAMTVTGPLHTGAVLDKLVGGPIAQHQDEAKKLSPTLLLNPASPALILIHGNKDTTLTVQNSISLAAECQTKGVPCELIVVKGAAHGLKGTNLDPPIAEVSRRCAAFLLKYLLPGAK